MLARATACGQSTQTPKSLESSPRPTNRQSAPITIATSYGIYHNDGKLIYAQNPCRAADAAAALFLHLAPVNVADLPEHRRQYGFANQDSHCGAAGSKRKEQCVSIGELPEYEFTRITTGQYLPGKGRLREVAAPLAR